MYYSPIDAIHRIRKLVSRIRRRVAWLLSEIRENTGLNALGVILIEGIKNRICFSTRVFSRALAYLASRSNIISVHDVTCFDNSARRRPTEVKGVREAVS